MLIRVLIYCDYGKPGDVVDVTPAQAINIIRSGKAESVKVDTNRNGAELKGAVKRG